MVRAFGLRSEMAAAGTPSVRSRARVDHLPKGFTPGFTIHQEGTDISQERVATVPGEPGALL